MSGLPIIDEAVLDTLIESIGEDGARAVLALFLDESHASLAIVAEAAASGGTDARERARRAAHSLKSAAGQVGAAALSAIAAAVERAAATGEPQLAARVAELHGCTEATDAAIRERLSQD